MLTIWTIQSTDCLTWFLSFTLVSHIPCQLYLTWIPLSGGFMNRHLFFPPNRNLWIDTGKTLCRFSLHVPDAYAFTLIDKSAKEQVQALERWVEILGTVQYVDQDSLNGALVSNKWPPLWNARRVGFGVLIHVCERANWSWTHTHTHNLVWSCQKRQSSLTQFIETQ